MPSDATATEWRPVVRPPFIPVEIDQDTIQFRIGPWAGPVFTVRDEDTEGSLARLLDYLDGEHTPMEIASEFNPTARSEIIELLDRLADEDVVVDGRELATKQLGGYLTRPDSTIREWPQAVGGATVTVIGGGTMGRTVARDLASCGIEDIVLYIDDPAEEDSPPGNQLQHPAIRKATGECLEESIRQADCAVYTATTPQPDQIATVNTIAIDHRTPWIPGQLHGLDGLVGPAILPGHTSCYSCFQTRASGTIPNSLTYQEIVHTSQKHQPVAPLPAYSRVLAGYLTLDTLHLLHGQTAILLGRLLHFDFFDFTISANAVLKAPRCPTCGPAQSVGRQQFLSFNQLIESPES